MTMKIGIGSYTFPWNVQRGMTADEILDAGIDFKVDVVQLCDNVDLSNLDWVGLCERATSAGIQIQVGGIGGPKEAIAMATAAEKVGSPIVRFVIGPAFATQSVPEIADDFRDVAKFCADHGSRLALENHDFFLTSQLAAIIEAIGNGCGAVLDTANSLSNLEGLESVVKNLGPHALCLHAKDVVAEREIHMYGFRIFGVQSGNGGIDFAYLRDNLPFNETVILEQWTPKVNNETPLSQEKATVASGLAHLRGIWQ